MTDEIVWEEPADSKRRACRNRAAQYVALMDNHGKWMLWDTCPADRQANCGNTADRRKGYVFRSRKQSDGTTKVYAKYEPKR